MRKWRNLSPKMLNHIMNMRSRLDHMNNVYNDNRHSVDGFVWDNIHEHDAARGRRKRGSW